MRSPRRPRVAPPLVERLGARLGPHHAAAVLSAAALGASAGCFKVDVASCTVACAVDQDCPGGLSCSAQGLCAPAGGDCANRPDADPGPDADLSMPQMLTVNVIGSASGTVTSDPAGIACMTTCSATFDPLSMVTLTATAAAEAVFSGWSGACAGQQGPTCTLTMDGAKTVDAEFSRHGELRWLRQVGHPGDDFLAEVEMVTDGNGDVVVVSTTDDDPSDSSNGLYVARLGRGDGVPLWEKTLRSSAGPFVVGKIGGVDVDAEGNVYVCAGVGGSAAMAATIDGTSIPLDMFGDIVVARLDAATGAIDWIASWGGTSQDDCGGLAVAGGDLFVAGESSSNPATLGGMTLNGADTGDAFLVRASLAAGAVSNIKALPGAFDLRQLVAHNATGRLALVGQYRSLFTLDSCTLGNPFASSPDGFLLDLRTSDLSCAWGRQFGSPNSGQAAAASAVAPVASGGWVVTGDFQGSVNFGNVTRGAVGGFDAFLARYDANGGPLWAFGYGGSGADFGAGVGVTSTGEVVFAGKFATSIQFGAATLTGTDDVFLTRLSSALTPTHEWAVSMGGAAADRVAALRVNANGTIYAAGSWNGMTVLGGMALTSALEDGWIASFVR